MPKNLLEIYREKEQKERIGKQIKNVDSQIGRLLKPTIALAFLLLLQVIADTTSLQFFNEKTKDSIELCIVIAMLFLLVGACERTYKHDQLTRQYKQIGTNTDISKR